MAGRLDEAFVKLNHLLEMSVGSLDKAYVKLNKRT